MEARRDIITYSRYTNEGFTRYVLHAPEYHNMTISHILYPYTYRRTYVPIMKAKTNKRIKHEDIASLP